jgi:hypothetical protein
MFGRSINPQLYTDQVPLCKQCSTAYFEYWTCGKVRSYVSLTCQCTSENPFVSICIKNIFLNGPSVRPQNVDAFADACAIACWSKCIEIPFIDHSCGMISSLSSIDSQIVFYLLLPSCMIVWSDPMVLNSHDLLCTHKFGELAKSAGQSDE